MFEGFFAAVASLLAWFYGLTHSYGGAIVLLTIAVMIVTAPLTLKSTKSMVQLQRLNPELKRLQAKYKDDRETLNKEMMAFYKANDINPMSGCLPVLIQAPVFLVLYRVLRGLIERNGGVGSGLGHVIGQRQANIGQTAWKLTDQPFKPQHLNHGTELYKSLTTNTKMNFLGMDLSITPVQSLRLGFWVAVPFVLLMVLMFGSQYIQNRQIQGRNTSAAAQPAMMKYLPFMLPVFSFGFPAGLGVYYFVQGICRIGLQHYITKSVYDSTSAADQTVGASATESDAGAGNGSGKGATMTKAAPTAPAKNVTEPRSAKSAAAQRKATESSKATGTHRRSGAPRSGSDRGSGTDGPTRKK